MFLPCSLGMLDKEGNDTAEIAANLTQSDPGGASKSCLAVAEEAVSSSSTALVTMSTDYVLRTPQQRYFLHNLSLTVACLQFVTCKTLRTSLTLAESH